MNLITFPVSSLENRMKKTNQRSIMKIGLSNLRQNSEKGRAWEVSTCPDNKPHQEWFLHAVKVFQDPSKILITHVRISNSTSNNLHN